MNVDLNGDSGGRDGWMDVKLAWAVGFLNEFLLRVA